MSFDRMLGALERIVDSLVGRRIDYCALYRSRVVAVDGSGLLEVQLDDTRWPSLTKVPIRVPFPGTTVEVQPGARVLVGWERGAESDPPSPYALLWESGTLANLTIPVETLIKLAGGTQFPALANLVSDELTTLKTAISNAGTTAHDGGAAFKAAIVGALSAWPGDVAATKVKVE